MAKIKEIALLSLCLLVNVYSDLPYKKPVTQVAWQGRCAQHSRALNDCNWCYCDKKHQYTCEARNCLFVDMFGHFNDAIREMDVGMEGHGSWRSTQSPCEPGVQYRRSGLLCVCTDDGVWPNPVCRDIFRILHSVETTNYLEVDGQTCSPTKLYLVGCNACFCPSTGRLDPDLCTRRDCSEDDPVTKEINIADTNGVQDEEIYAECYPDRQYKYGCKTCTCLRNNRLHCGNCTFEKESDIQSFCSHVEPGRIFNVGCNLCYCDDKNFAYCSTKKCLISRRESLSLRNSDEYEQGKYIENSGDFDPKNCTPGNSYKKDCNICFCFLDKEKVLSGCTMMNCFVRHPNHQYALRSSIHMDCVKGTTYEMDCLICQCDEYGGVKSQLCWKKPGCRSRELHTETGLNDLAQSPGYCTPHQMYKLDCNTCKCLSDGRTVQCSSRVCKSVQEPVSVEIIPVTQVGASCPRGTSYKVRCNYCFCLSNGNALCTTHNCRNRGE